MSAKYAPAAFFRQGNDALHALELDHNQAQNMRMKIGTSINRIRRAKGITQTQIAEAINLDQGNLSRIINNHQEATFARLEAIAAFLGVRIYEIVRIAEMGDDPDPRKLPLYALIDSMSPDQLRAFIRSTDPDGAMTELNDEGATVD